LSVSGSAFFSAIEKKVFCYEGKGIGKRRFMPNRAPSLRGKTPSVVRRCGGGGGRGKEKMEIAEAALFGRPGGNTLRRERKSMEVCPVDERAKGKKLARDDLERRHTSGSDPRGKRRAVKIQTRPGKWKTRSEKHREQEAAKSTEIDFLSFMNRTGSFKLLAG